MELATIIKECGGEIIKECGGEIDLIISTGDRRGVGTIPEFYIGGPHGNKRAEAHLKRFVPSFRINTFEEGPRVLLFLLATRNSGAFEDKKSSFCLFGLLCQGNRWRPYGLPVDKLHRATTPQRGI